MLRNYIILLTFAFFACTLAEDLYPDKYDYIDTDAILANDRQREQYYKCFVSTGPCVTPDQLFFKKYLPDAIATKCRRCTERQKQVFDKVTDWYVTNQPDKWNVFVKKMLDDTINRKETME